MDDALRLADMYADRVYDYRRHASPETHHDMMVFRNALEGKLRRQHDEIASLRAEVERLRGVLTAIVDFVDGPAEGKRPDVFGLLINSARTALALKEDKE